MSVQEMSDQSDDLIGPPPNKVYIKKAKIKHKEEEKVEVNLNFSNRNLEKIVGS